MINVYKGVSIAVAAVALAASISAPAHAEERERGRVITGEVQTSRGVYTGERVVRAGPGYRTRDTVVTGPNGGQTTVNEARQWDRGAGVSSYDRVRTFNDGTQRSIEADTQRLEPGVFQRTRTVTARDGETRTRTGTATVQPLPRE